MEKLTIYLDLETTARGPDNSPEAHYKENEVVLCGYLLGDAITVTNSLDPLIRELSELMSFASDITLVAHNLKFDLKYLVREYPDFPWHKLKFYDTMTAEYLISGHSTKFISLEDAANTYGLEFEKSIDLGAYIAQGVDISDVDVQELTQYLEADVKVLKEIHFHQDTTCDMDYILPLAKMEVNGLPLDVDKCKTLAKDLITSIDSHTELVSHMVLAAVEWDDHKPVDPEDFKPLAPRTMSYILTGVPEHGIGGSAKAKRKLLLNQQPLLDEDSIKRIWKDIKPNPHLGYPINHSVLDKLLTFPLISNYKLAKDKRKLLETYCNPFLTQAKDTGGTVHPKINTTATATGRLSSSNPNGQNIPPKARELFKSTEGELYEIDFAQLEIVGAATLSGCLDLRRDLLQGKDIHFETGRIVFGWQTPADMTKKDRKLVKNVNFGVLYGGGAKGLSEQTGQNINLIKQLIDAFYVKYPTIRQWQDEVLDAVKANSHPHGWIDYESYNRACWWIPHEHGRRKFTFTESKSPYWLKVKEGRSFSFKPTETKNYPIQGFAGGDIVMTALSILDSILSGTSAKLRMTVHDSIVVDWEKDKEEELRALMDHVVKYVREAFDIKVPLMFDIEHEVYWL